MNKQAIKDLAEGKKTDAVKEFLKRYEIRPRENKEEQNMNKQETAWQKKKRNRTEPLQQSEVHKHPSNNSNRRHSRCHKSRKARAIVTMRT